MKRLIIVGAGGLGREVYTWTEAHPDCGCLWEIAGFLDDNPAALDRFDYPVGILAAVVDYAPQPNDLFLCAIGSPSIKRRVCGKLLGSGAEFISLVHPTAVIGSSGGGPQRIGALSRGGGAAAGTPSAQSLERFDMTGWPAWGWGS